MRAPILLLLAAVSTAGSVVSVKSCTTQTCSGSCHVANYSIGQCYPGAHDLSFIIHPATSGICVPASRFSDSACNSATQSLDLPCTRCEFGSSFDCGGLPTGMFWMHSCNMGCGNCSTTIAGFGSCVKLGNDDYGLVNRPENCKIFVRDTYRGLRCNAGGVSPLETEAFWSGKCGSGTVISG